MGRSNVIWVDEKTLSKDISGKVYMVTGANSGVGLETTRQLIKQGGHVIMACRRPDAAEEVAQSFIGLKGSYEVMRLDLADLQSVRDFVDEFLKKHDKLDALVCNAGLRLLKVSLLKPSDRHSKKRLTSASVVVLGNSPG